MLSARVIAPADLTAEDIARWRAFQATDPILQSPFYAPEFAQCVGAARADAFVAVFSRGGAPVAFLPFHRLRGGVGKPIGGPISDYQGLIAAEGFAADAEELLALSGLAAYDFNHAPEAQIWLSAAAVARAPSPRMNLAGGYERYFAGQPKAGRHAIKDTERRMRKLGEDIGPVRFVYDDRSEAAWRALIEMKNASFREMGVASILDVAWVRKALEAIRARSNKEFAGLLSTVYAGDRLVAAHFGMRTSTTWCWWFNAYDKAYSAYAPGLVTILEAARRAEAEGLTTIDFGRGDQPYKRRFANESVFLCEGTVERGNVAAGHLRRIQKACLAALNRPGLEEAARFTRRAFGRLATGMRLPVEK